jgi:uncharacterized protein YqjF (DUF2071 family)
MTTGKQFQMTMRDMLFITWAVQPEAARKIVDRRLELDTLTDSGGQVVALVSAVCFNVDDVHSSVLPLPRLSFGQVNYRVYVRAGEVPAVCFLDIKVNSRTVTTLTGFLGVPIHYEDVEIRTAPSGDGLLRYMIESAGIRAVAVVGGQPDKALARLEIESAFITQRLVGYAGTGDSMFKIEVDQLGLEPVSARLESVNATRLEQLGLLNLDQSTRPDSVLFVREARFGAHTPSRAQLY